MRDWVTTCVSVIHESLRLGKREAVSESFKVPGTPAEYVEALRSLVDLDAWQEAAPFFVSDHGAESLDAELANRSSQGLIDEGYPDVLRILKTIGFDPDWAEFCQALSARVTVGQNLETGELAGSLSTLWYLDTQGADLAHSTLETLATSGALLDQLQQASADNDYEAVAFALVTVLIRHPSGRIATPQGQTQRGTATYTELMANSGAARHLLPHLARIIRRFGLLRQILDALDQAPPSAIIDELVGTLADDEHALELFSPDVLYVHRHYLTKALEDEVRQELIVKSCRHAGFMKYLAELEFDVRGAPTYLDVVEANAGHGRQAFLKSVVTKLQGLSAEEWEVELGEDESSVIDLALAIQAEIPTELKESLSTPLRERAQQITDGELEANTNDGRFDDLISTLESSANKTLLRDVRDHLLSRGEDDDVAAALSLYGSTLLSSGVLLEKADDVVRGLARKVIDRRGAEELVSLTDLLREGSVLSGAKSESRTALARKLGEAIEDEDLDDETKAAISELRDASEKAT